MKISCGDCGSEYEIKLTDKFMKPSDVEYCAICGSKLDEEGDDEEEEDDK